MLKQKKKKTSAKAAKLKADAACVVGECDEKPHARGMCAVHYQRWRRHGDPTIPVKEYRANPWIRFWSRVEPGDCWVWMGTRDKLGYGHFFVGSSRFLAHRWAWLWLVGPIADGLELDHLCRNSSCVNPDHLEPVTHAENMRRGIIQAINERKPRRSVCHRGHPFTEENTYHRTDGSRHCRTCALLKQRLLRGTTEFRKITV